MSCHHHKARAAKEEGSLRIRNLEEALQRLGAARGAEAMTAELFNAVAESDAAKRSEARLRSELEYERSRIAATDRRYNEAVQAVHDKDMELKEAWVYWMLLLGADQPSSGLAPVSAKGPRENGTSAAIKPTRNYAAAAAAGIRTAPGPGVQDVLLAGGSQLLDLSLERRLRSQMEELAKKQQIIGKLVEQAEK